MMGLLIGLHVLVCLLLIIMILIQAGRGGGLVEGFSGVESMFGPKTNRFLTRTTTTLAVMFFLTCLSLALLSVKQSRSLMSNIKNAPVTHSAAGTPQAKENTPQAQAVSPKIETTQNAVQDKNPGELPKAK